MSGFMQDPTALGAKKIGLEDTFHFKCNACGNCCRGRLNEVVGTGIFLSGPDVWRIMDYTKLTFDELLEKHIVVSMDPDLKIKTCSLRFKYSGSCVFLKNGKCSIYESRPRTCALYPVGRSVLVERIGKHFVHYEDNYVINKSELYYKCDYSSNDIYKVSEWISRNGIPVNDVEDIEWLCKMAEYSNMANNKNLDANKIDDIFDKLYRKSRG